MQKSTHMGVSQHSKDATQTQQQRPEPPTVTHIWHAVHQVLSAMNSVVLFIPQAHMRKSINDTAVSKSGERIWREKNEPGR